MSACRIVVSCDVTQACAGPWLLAFDLVYRLICCLDKVIAGGLSAIIMTPIAEVYAARKLLVRLGFKTNTNEETFS